LGAVVNKDPSLAAAHPIWHADWEQVWKAAAESNVIIHFHAAGGTTTVSPSDGNTSSFFAWYGVAQMQMDESLASIIACGALERYPSLRVVIGEGGIGWIPYLLDRMDYELVDQRERLEGVLTEKPSVLFRRQMYATFQKETYGPLLASHFGQDNFMWGADYPHEDSVWPDSRETIREYMGSLDPIIRQKIVNDNVTRLYGI